MTMLHRFFKEGDWFAPKRYGYGAGFPIAWQGWALLAAHIGLIIGIALVPGIHPAAAMAGILLAGLAPLPLYAARTRGGWRWRWGEAD
jgi:hypothetical protein